MTKRLISMFVAVCMAVTIIPLTATTAWAQTVSKDDWSGQTTRNLIPAMNEGDTLTAVGWGNVGDQIRLTAYRIDDGNYTNKIGIQARNTSHDIGNRDYTGGVYWQIDFSAGDRMKINKGDLLLSAGARYWYQASSTHYTSLRFEFYDQNNDLLDNSQKATNSNYWVAQHDTWLELNEIKIPVNTAYVRIWFSNWGSNAGRPFIGDFTATLTDRTTPSYVAATAVSESGTYKIGDKIRFRVEMDEPVTVTNGGVLTTNVGDAAYVGQKLGDASDVGQYIYYDLTVTDQLSTTGNQVAVQPTGVSGLSVSDDAGNPTTVNSGDNCSASGIYFDNQYPSVTQASLYSVNGSTTLPSQVIPEDMVTYGITFDETVSFSNNPTLTFSVDGTSFSCTASGGNVSADGKTLYFTAALSNCGVNGTLTLTGISGLSLTDANGNTIDYANDSLSSNGIVYQSVFSVSEVLTNLDLTDAAETVSYGSAWTGRLTAQKGYELPSAITVQVGNTTIASGYTYNASSGEIEITADVIKDDIVLTASAVPQTYTITFDMQGGSGGTQSVEVTYTLALTSITPPSRDGYTFGGYYTEENGAGVQYYSYDGNSEKTYDKTSDLTLYAKWTPLEYTVTLDAAGGTGGETVTATYDADMPEITLPTRTGYTFDGYFTQTGGEGEQYYDADGNSVKAYDKTEGITLYAKWNANSYVVTLDMQGGSGGTQSVEATYDSAMPSVTPPLRIGYTFGGYFAQPNGGGAQYYYADGGSARSYDMADTCTLYAKWTANSYDVVLNAQGGSGGVTVTAIYDSEMPVIVLPDRPGYIFGGYFDEVNGEGTKYYNADGSSATKYDQANGITLYAFWTPITYDIQLYSRGENVGTIKGVTYGQLRLPSAESLGISYPNYNFVGWNIYDEQNWAMYVADTDYSAGLATKQGETAYVYAAWLEKDKYTITYDANGGQGAPAAVEVHVDETVSLSESIPSRENYTFVGWAGNPDSSAADYQPGDRFTMGNSLVTLFAVWQQNPALTYHANGGVFSTYAGAAYPVAGSKVTLTSARPQKEGYTFIGWAESETATAADIITSPYTMPSEDTVLYAVYEPINYTVDVYASDGYAVHGIDAGGYTIGEYAEFTVEGTEPKVYINGVLALPTEGVYRFEINSDASVVVSDASMYHVIYSANGGINPPVDMKAYGDGDTAVIQTDAPSRTGYLFSGWAQTPDAETAQYEGGDRIPVSGGDIVLYAVWEPITYTIKYDANGGSGIMAATEAAYDQDVPLLANTFTMVGRQFVGWAFEADGELAYADGAVVKNLTDTQGGEITLYALWKGASTTIRFQFEGGASGTAACEVVYGEILPQENLTAPSRYGYTFAGYYTAQNKGGELVYTEDMSLSEYYRENAWDSVLTEFDLYAAWDPVEYTVAFVNGTETLSTRIEAVYGQSFRLPTAESLGIDVPEGTSFRGWSIASGSDVVYYRDGQEITTGLTGENGATVYLYAVILENESYTVTLPASGEGYKVSYQGEALTAQREIEVYESEDISFTVTVEDGYSADKMNVLANGIMLGATQIQGNAYVYSMKNISANTDVNIYNISREKFSIILNDGTGYSVSPKNTTVESMDDFTFTVTLLEGYKTATPVVYVNGAAVSGTKNEDGFTYTIPKVTEQPVISVSVEPKPQYTVTFISNGGIYSISTVEEDMNVSQPDIPERYGYTFGGWYIDKDCTLSYDFRTAVTGSVTLYAKWTADTYTVEYNKNTTEDVLIPGGQTKTHDIVLMLSPDKPVRTGYTFIGWNTRADAAGTSYDAGSELSVNSNITLYAQWSIHKYPVTLIMGDGINGTISSNEAAYNETVRVTATSADGYNEPVITAVPQENAELVSEGVYRITGPVSFVADAEAKAIYTANFYLDGGLYHTQSAIEGSASTIILPNPPTKQGHTFMGWFTEPTDGIKVDASTVLDENMSLYAQFEANSFHVTEAQSGTGYTVESTGSTNVPYGGSYTFTVTILAHYNGDNMRVYANGILLIPDVGENTYTYTVENITSNQVITVSGVRINKHTVTYTVDGQVYTTETVDYHQKITEPVAPAKEGKSFKGWSDGVDMWDFESDSVTGDLTLNAVWEGDSFTITEAQSGTGYTVESTDSTNVPYGGSYTFTVTISDHFSGENMKVYANGVLLIPDVNGNAYTYTVGNITADTVITVEGVKADIYTVTYLVDGEVYHSENVVYTEKAQKPISPLKAGYTFEGWFIGNDEWDFAMGVESDLELEAMFAPLTYPVTVPENQTGFTVNVSSVNPVEYGGSFAFDIIVDDGYNTADMMVYANGVLLERLSENGNTVSYEIFNITEPTVITVRGIGQNTYYVTYRTNTTEYVGNMPQNSIKTHNKDVTISDLVPERYGYNFIGWSTTENGAVEYNGGDRYSENNDLTLYAVWEAMRFAVSFETSGGSINSGEITEYTYGIGALLPTDVTKEGYNFAGWYEDALLQGVRVYEIKASDYGDKKYYAAYSIADVVLNGYTGEYDGNGHNIAYEITDNLTVENYQWYFIPEDSDEAMAVQSDSYNSYTVKDVADSGEYYCYIEALSDDYVVRFFTERASVSITKKPVFVKAADSSKVYDAQPLETSDVAFTGGTALAENHTVSVTMTEESTVTNTGTQLNEIDQITIFDSENKDVTGNYEIVKQSGTLIVTPLTLTVEAEDVRVSRGSELSAGRLYEISGVLGDEALSLSNISVTAKNEDGEDIAFEDITDSAGTYTVTINYDGFNGEGNENYQGSGTITAAVTVYIRSTGGGGGSGGGGTATTRSYTVTFDTNGGSSVESQTVRANTTADEPNAPEREGYIFDGWYSDENLTDKFDFATKITGNITIYAKWTEAKENEEDKEDEEQNPSDEPSVSNPSDTGVAELLETENHLKYLNGYYDGTFKPENNMTRAEAAQMFYNLLLDKNVAGNSAFHDVSRDAWYYNAVITLANMGIINGKGNGVFDPDGEITRAEFTAIAMRFTNIEVNGTESFADVSLNHWAAEDIADAAALGWISGSGDGNFSPDTAITRGAVAKIVNNMLGRKADAEYVNNNIDVINQFTDVLPSAWYYMDVVEATNTHEYEKIDGTESWK